MDERITDHREMTIDEFLAFTDTRPDDESRELIEGVPVLSPSPTDFQQIIAGNITTLLNNERKRTKATWRPLIGTGTRVPVSPRSLPQPDVMVKARAATGSAVSDEAVVLFEILSKSNTKKDQAWRKKVYTSIPNCEHYVTVEQKRTRVLCYDRATNWHAMELRSLDDALELPALAAKLPLAEIYDGTPVAPNNGD